MRRVRLFYLSNFLSCRHVAALEMAVTTDPIVAGFARASGSGGVHGKYHAPLRPRPDKR